VGDDEIENSFSEFWGWYSIISSLAENKVWQIDGVTNISLVSALNNLSYLMELAKEKEKFLTNLQVTSTTNNSELILLLLQGVISFNEDSDTPKSETVKRYSNDMIQYGINTRIIGSTLGSISNPITQVELESIYMFSEWSEEKFKTLYSRLKTDPSITFYGYMNGTKLSIVNITDKNNLDNLKQKGQVCSTTVTSKLIEYYSTLVTTEPPKNKGELCNGIQKALSSISLFPLETSLLLTRSTHESLRFYITKWKKEEEEILKNRKKEELKRIKEASK
jgi:hypothetical protein